MATKKNVCCIAGEFARVKVGAASRPFRFALSCACMPPLDDPSMTVELYPRQYGGLNSATALYSAVNYLGTAGIIVNLFFFFLAHFYLTVSGQDVVTGFVPPRPRFLPSIIIAHRVQQPHCWTIFHRWRVLLTHHALSRFPQVNPHEYTRVCTRGGSNSRN